MAKLNFLEQGRMDSLLDGNLYFAGHCQRVLKLDTHFQVKFNTYFHMVFFTCQAGWQNLQENRNPMAITKKLIVESFCSGTRNSFSTVGEENRDKNGIK